MKVLYLSHFYDNKTPSYGGKDSLVVNAIVSNGKYPNSDFLYSRKYDMVIPFDRYSRELKTVKYFDTDYYFKHKKRYKY